jgi:hypothetical protein
LSEKHVHPFSINLSAPVWNLLPVDGKSLIIIEQRDDRIRQASFSAFDFADNRFLWQDIVLSEKWWVNLAGHTKDHIVLKVFENTENPDKTSFRFLEIETGKVISDNPQQIEWIHTNNTVHPFQYLDGEPEFETVKNFLRSTRQLMAKLGAEYLEYAGHVIISYYAGDPTGFNNLLALFNSKGECLYETEIGTNLKGIGTNTFFITSGNLFFVKNKTELVTFRIV